MSLEEYAQIDIVATKGKEVKLFIIEGRKWADIEGAGTKLLAKLENIKRYANSKEARRKFRGKKITVALDFKYDIPTNIKKLLKQEAVELYINHKRIKL